MTRNWWDKLTTQYIHNAELGLAVDFSHMATSDGIDDELGEAVAAAVSAMERLEAGEEVNVDEDRMVGHYWLRAPDRAPSQTVSAEILDTQKRLKNFVRSIHDNELRPPKGDGFFALLLIGIGGSALGPQLLLDALGTTEDALIARFLDNTDPAGMERTLAEMEEVLAQTLTVVISKSGSTVETRNGMIVAAEHYRRAGLDFTKHAVAITSPGSKLDEQARKDKWLRSFPLWDWVGGRTSITSPVGLLPAGLIGADIDAFLDGARRCDAWTRDPDPHANPALALALTWFDALRRGRRSMVVLPYCDRLALLGRYLQQLVMESIGKAKDRDGNEVHHGLSVFGHKGTTDQHASVQQLREGPNDFLVTFIDVLGGDASDAIEVEDGITSGDYLHAFLAGTRAALAEADRESITITLNQLDAGALGALIALFERAVGFLGELLNVNAYNQPGVEAGKKAAGEQIALQRRVLDVLRSRPEDALTAADVTEALNESDHAADIWAILTRLAAGGRGVHVSADTPASTPFETAFRADRT